MNVQQLTARFQALNLNGSDLSVEVRQENPRDRRVTSVSITGRLVHPMNDVEDAEFQFVIDIDRPTKSISSNVQGMIIDHEEGEAYPATMSLLSGVEAFQEAEAIANTLEALLTPEPPAEPTVTLQKSLDGVHDVVACFEEAGCDLPEKWIRIFEQGLSRYRDSSQQGGVIDYTFSVRDARALRNRAHRAARTWIKEYGDDWQNHILQELRDRLDDALAEAA